MENNAMLPLTLLPVLASITLPDAFWSLAFAVVTGGATALLATWRSSAVYGEKFSNQANQIEQLQKSMDEIRANCVTESSRQRLTAIEVEFKNLDQLSRDLLKYRETDVKEINRLISEIQQWMSRLETMVEYSLEDKKH